MVYDKSGIFFSLFGWREGGFREAVADGEKAFPGKLSLTGKCIPGRLCQREMAFPGKLSLTEGSGKRTPGGKRMVISTGFRVGKN